MAMRAGSDVGKHKTAALLGPHSTRSGDGHSQADTAERSVAESSRSRPVEGQGHIVRGGGGGGGGETPSEGQGQASAAAESWSA